MANFRKGTWKLGENIRSVGGGEMYYLATLKHVINLNTQKSFTGLDYEWSLPESDARTGFVFSFLFFSFGGGLLMSFHGHSCPSIMIICIQPRRYWPIVDIIYESF